MRISDWSSDVCSSDLPRSAERFNQSMSLSLEGIGAQLQKQDDVVVIRDLIAGGPAKTSGKFTPGDRIVGVGQDESGPMEDVIGWRIADVVEKIRGPNGNRLRLGVPPAAMGRDAEPPPLLPQRQDGDGTGKRRD